MYILKCFILFVANVLRKGNNSNNIFSSLKIPFEGEVRSRKSKKERQYINDQRKIIYETPHRKQTTKHYEPH